MGSSLSWLQSKVIGPGVKSCPEHQVPGHARSRRLRSPLELEVPRMEGDRFLDMLVPVFPVMHADELFVLVSNVLRFQVFVKGPILLDQKIALAAINAKRGNAAVV